jgi:hypothetical protein
VIALELKRACRYFGSRNGRPGRSGEFDVFVNDSSVFTLVSPSFHPRSQS